MNLKSLLWFPAVSTGTVALRVRRKRDVSQSKHKRPCRMETFINSEHQNRTRRQALTLMCLFVPSLPHVYPPTRSCQLGLQIPLDLFPPSIGCLVGFERESRWFHPQCVCTSFKGDSLYKETGMSSTIRSLCNI